MISRFNTFSIPRGNPDNEQRNTVPIALSELPGSAIWENSAIRFCPVSDFDIYYFNHAFITNRDAEPPQERKIALKGKGI